MFHSSSLRRGRHSEPGRIYLVTTLTHGRQPLFVDFQLARLVISQLRESDGLGRCKTLAYVLMPDHLHWLLQLEDAELSELVGTIKANAARLINEVCGAQGMKRWQDGFFDHALRMEEDLAASARYIVANPLRAGIVSWIGDYPHWDAVWL